MEHFDKKQILGVVQLNTTQTRIKVVAVQTSKGSFTAYTGVTHIINAPEKPDKREKHLFETAEHQNNLVIANRGAILEKVQALGFFPKLSKLKYAKKALSELQK